MINRSLWKFKLKTEAEQRFLSGDFGTSCGSTYFRQYDTRRERDHWQLIKNISEDIRTAKNKLNEGEFKKWMSTEYGSAYAKIIVDGKEAKMLAYFKNEKCMTEAFTKSVFDEIWTFGIEQDIMKEEKT